MALVLKSHIIRIVLGLILFICGCGVIAYPTIRAATLFLGFDRPKEYLVLLQNNTEIRASGGFMGSYARVQFSKGAFHIQKIEDIYVPDGALQGHVDPPLPIQQAFGQGWFRLRDSNWEPDFPTAATTIRWFFEHGGEIKADGIIAINLTFIHELLRVTGPLRLPHEETPVTVETVYQRTQSAAGLGFFPGSTQKRDFLSTLGRELVRSWPTVSWNQKLQFVRRLFVLIRERHIFVSVDDPRVMAVVKKFGADGSLPVLSREEDFISLSESNLGSNKANCCVKRSLDVAITKKENQLHHTVRVTFQNDNPATLKQPPASWGGAYVVYLRVLLPKEAILHDVKVGEFGRSLDGKDSPLDLPEQAFLAHGASRADLVQTQVYEDKGIQAIGFWVLVDAQQSQDVVITYDLPFHGQRVLRLQKQGGIDVVPVFLHGMKTTHIDLREEMLLAL